MQNIYSSVHTKHGTPAVIVMFSLSNASCQAAIWVVSYFAWYKSGNIECGPIYRQSEPRFNSRTVWDANLISSRHCKQIKLPANVLKLAFRYAYRQPVPSDSHSDLTAELSEISLFWYFVNCSGGALGSEVAASKSSRHQETGEIWIMKEDSQISGLIYLETTDWGKLATPWCYIMLQFLL